MFQKYETNPTGLIFGGAFALVLSIFGLRAFNQYLFTAADITDLELQLAIGGNIIGIVVGILGLAMLGFGIHYTLKDRREKKA